MNGHDAPARRAWFAVVVAMAAASLAGCSDREADRAQLGLTSDRLTGAVRIVGSTTMMPLVTAMATEFRKQQPAVSIEIQGGGTAQGLKILQAGKADIAMVARVLAANERDLLPFVIARDGLAISVHADNPVNLLSDEQVAGIYSKRIVNWREVGGRDAPIYVIGVSAGAAATELFLRNFPLTPGELRPDIVIDPNPQRFAALSGNPVAILYGSLGESERRAQAGEKVKALPNAGIAATIDNLAAGRYSVARPLSLVTRGLPSGAAKAFIDYARAPAAISMIERFEFAPYRD